MKIWILNGPNLNMLGIREPALYGRGDYASLEAYCRSACEEISATVAGGIECEIFQSNHEGTLVDTIQRAYFEGVNGIVINPGAYTHTSIAILDALKAVSIPAAEVHLTDIRQREPFRQVSYAGMACEAHYMGDGFEGYRKAVAYLAEKYGKRA